MRYRIAALAIVGAVVWIIVAAAAGTDVGRASAGVALGLALIVASIAGEAVEAIGFPRLTGYLVFGILAGPFVLSTLTRPVARDVQFVNQLAIALIAFTAGLQLNVTRLRPRLREVATIGGVALALTWLAVFAAVFAMWPWIGIAGGISPAQRVAVAAIAATVIAVASPTVTIAVIAETRARGPFSELAMAVVVLGDLMMVVVFSVAIEVARMAFGDPTAASGAYVAHLGWSLLGSTAFGAIVGAAFALYLRLVGRELTLVLLAACVVLGAVGVELRFQPLVAAIAAGVVVQNVSTTAGDALRDAIERGSQPVLIIFFAAAGAALQLDALATIGIAAAVLSGVRFIAVRGGVRLGARWAGSEPGVGRWLWRALISKGGLTLALTVIVAGEYPDWGGRLETLVIAILALHELAGPILFKSALVEAREVDRADGGLVVVSNREPWLHEFAPDGTIRARPTPGGVSVALDALMRERGGVWVAHGAGGADRAVVDQDDSIEVPPDAPAYRLRRLWLTPAEEEGYYAGFSNSALWPLAHQAHVRPVFRAEDWQTYQAVNRRFAEATAAEAPSGDSPVFINDYHLALVGRYLRELRPSLRTALFWHIPWPDPDRLRINPWRRELLEGLLSNDLLAFQLARDQRNFLLAASDELGVSIDGETVFFGDRPARVVSVPIGADFDRIEEILADPALAATIERLSHELDLTGKIVGVGVDRLDYTKGIPERLRAIDRVLDARPELEGRLVFAQIGVPSRTDVPAYAEIAEEVDAEVARINEKHAGAPPIRYVKRALALPELVALYRRADFCVVSSLHDGMNLVAKEFVAARDDHGGVLILSELAGAAQELRDALLINPYDEAGFAQAIETAILMPSWERRRRMQALRKIVAGRDVLAWASDILRQLRRRSGR